MTLPARIAGPIRPMWFIGLIGLTGLAMAGGCTSDPTTTSDPAAVASNTGPQTSACKGTGSPTAATVPYDEAAGVAPDLLSLDYYLPTVAEGCEPVPLVVYVHGGAFVRGDKATKIDDKVSLFTDEGWAFASVNYRLSPTSPTSPHNDPSQVRYPTHEEDVAHALAWISNHADELGIDPDRVLFMGHSSGAFIASLLSTDTSFLEDGAISPDVPLCTASLDTEYNVTDQVAQGGAQEALYRNAFGDDPAVWAEGSPINHTDAGARRPKFLVITQGPARRVEPSRRFAAALERGGTPAATIDVSPLDHEGINAAVGQAGETVVTPPLMDFYRECVADAA